MPCERLFYQEQGRDTPSLCRAENEAQKEKNGGLDRIQRPAGGVAYDQGVVADGINESEAIPLPEQSMLKNFTLLRAENASDQGISTGNQGGIATRIGATA